MDAKDTARDLLAQQRLHEEQQQKSRLTRTHQEIQQENSTIDSEARELLTEKRQHQKHLEDSLLSRAETESHS